VALAIEGGGMRGTISAGMPWPWTSSAWSPPSTPSTAPRPEPAAPPAPA